MCYNKIYLEKTLYKRVDSYEQVHVSVKTIVIMGEGWGVSTKSLKESCKTLDCQIHDIVDYVPDDDDVQEK